MHRLSLDYYDEVQFDQPLSPKSFHIRSRCRRLLTEKVSRIPLMEFSQSDLATTSRYRDPIPGKRSLQGRTA